MKREKKNPILAKLSHKFVKGVQSVTNIHRDTEVMETLTLAIQSIFDCCDNSAVKRKLEKLAEDFKYSDPVSSEKTQELEETLYNEIEELDGLMDEGSDEEILSQISKISAMLKKRNTVCKNAKR